MENLENDFQSSLIKHFIHVSDPRSDINVKHELIDILFIAICAVLCGVEYWEEIEDFGISREEWFRKYLKLPNGIPSHDRIRAVFVHLDPDELEKCFRSWVSEIIGEVKTELVISIDGKTNRGTRDDAKGKKAIHLVSAWSKELSLVLGQVKTDEKSNEITAIPKLIEALNLKKSLVTIDAMGCQKEIVKKIIDKDANYVIGLKGNQKALHTQTVEAFEKNEKMISTYNEGETTSHGRTEEREYALIDVPDYFTEKYTWEGLKSLGRVVSSRLIKGILTTETRYFISSLKATEATRFANGVRSHWGIENSLHWQLDVSFGEDQCRKRAKNAAQNFAVLRKIVINILKQERSTKKGIKRKMRMAGYRQDYFLQILSMF